MARPRSQRPGTVGLVTSVRPHSKWTDDEIDPLRSALEGCGINTEVVLWHEDCQWADYSLLIMKSPWDVYEDRRFSEYADWLEHVSRQTRVLNPPDVIRWNLDKRHLLELQNQDVPVVPTQIVEPGEAPSIPEKDFVIKPTSSGGATNTSRYGTGEMTRAKEHVAFLHSQEYGAIIQPYVPEVDSSGEHGLIFFDGEFDHAIEKGAVLTAGDPWDADKVAHPNPRPYTPTPDELRVALRALDAVPADAPLLYARVDMVNSVEHGPMIMELELDSPVLFLGESDGAYGRYAAAIQQRL